MLEVLIIAGQMFFVDSVDGVNNIFDEEDMFDEPLNGVGIPYAHDCV